MVDKHYLVLGVRKIQPSIFSVLVCFVPNHNCLVFQTPPTVYYIPEFITEGEAGYLWKQVSW